MTSPAAQRFAFFEGDYVPHEQARVPISSHVVNYGTGCFEGIRAYWNSEREQLYVTLLDAHIDRPRGSSTSATTARATICATSCSSCCDATTCARTPTSAR